MIKIKRIFLVLILVFVLFYSLYRISDFFTVNNQDTDNTSFTNYYKLEKDTLDIAIFGNSHSFDTYNPTIISSSLKVDSFNFKSRSGYIAQIYYQLVEVLKTQKPKIIVIESFSLRYNENPKEYESKVISWAYDTMRFSANKIEAINNSTSKETRLQHYLPIIKYHSNWKDVELNEELIEKLNPKFDNNFYWGYSLYNYLPYKVENDPIYIPAKTEPDLSIFSDERIEYLDKITALCKANGIKQIYVTTPFIAQLGVTSNESISIMKALEDYANNNDIDIVNYFDLLDEVDLDKTDLSNGGHTNVIGAYKISTYLAEYIEANYSELFSISNWDYQDELEKKHEVFIQEYNNALLENNRTIMGNKLNSIAYRGNLAEYLKIANEENYITIISSRNSSNLKLNDDIFSSMHELGLEAKFVPGELSNYIAIVDGGGGGVAFERLSTDDGLEIDSKHDYTGLVAPIRILIESSTESVYGNSVIKINNEDYSKNQEGFNIVVYDKILQAVVSSVNFNINCTEQHFFDRNNAYAMFESSASVFSLVGFNEEIQGQKKAEINVCDSTSSISARIYRDSSTVEVTVLKEISGHIVLSLDVYAYDACMLEVKFGDAIERAQLITGDNEIYVEFESLGSITDIDIKSPDNINNFKIQSIKIAELDND